MAHRFWTKREGLGLRVVSNNSDKAKPPERKKAVVKDKRGQRKPIDQTPKGSR
jgi:hypothetical protein